MTELRQRMDDDMLARGLADRTRESYLWAVTGLARFYQRAPDQISDAEIQGYLLHLLRDRQRSWSTCNIVVNGLRFFYHTTLKRDRTTFTIPSPRHSGKLPVVLSRDEVQRLIDAAITPRHRTMLLTTYAAGLRLTEVLHLRVHDIDSARMTIRVVQGKGGKDRYTVLSPRLLEALRAYWRVEHPRTMADGLKPQALGELTFAIIRETVNDMVTVSEEEIRGTLAFVWTRMKAVVEPSGVVALAPVFHRKLGLRGQRVGVIFSGGNADIGAVADWLRAPTA